MIMIRDQYLFITDQTNIGHYENCLEKRIKETGLSQREVARYVDMAPGTISSLKGAAPGQIRLDTLLRLSWFFSHKLGRLITPDDILRYVPPPELKSDMNTR
jgi:DNA-binding Xre family transcriptional regulator